MRQERAPEEADPTDPLGLTPSQRAHSDAPGATVGFIRDGWYFEHHRQEWHRYVDDVLAETLPANARPVETARMRRAAADGVL